MGQFTIVLPNHQQAEVRWGKIRKASLFPGLFKKNSFLSEVKKGYIVKFESMPNGPVEYRLLKTKEGEWTAIDDGGFHVTPDDQVSIAIKKAIDDYEDSHHRLNA